MTSIPQTDPLAETGHIPSLHALAVAAHNERIEAERIKDEEEREMARETAINKLFSLMGSAFGDDHCKHPSIYALTSEDVRFAEDTPVAAPQPFVTLEGLTFTTAFDFKQYPYRKELVIEIACDAPGCSARYYSNPIQSLADVGAVLTGLHGSQCPGCQQDGFADDAPDYGADAQEAQEEANGTAH